MEYTIVKWLHILSSTLLFGTGIGSAFYMLMASRTRVPRTVAAVVRLVVVADWLFTAPTAIIQPLTGFYLMHLAKIPMQSRWIAWSLGLYVLAIACWLPVVWIQIRMRDMAIKAARQHSLLPAQYWRYLMVWIALGTVAFIAFLVIFYLMVGKPAG